MPIVTVFIFYNNFYREIVVEYKQSYNRHTLLKFIMLIVQQ